MYIYFIYAYINTSFIYILYTYTHGPAGESWESTRSCLVSEAVRPDGKYNAAKVSLQENPGASATAAAAAAAGMAWVNIFWGLVGTTDFCSFVVLICVYMFLTSFILGYLEVISAN